MIIVFEGVVRNQVRKRLPVLGERWESTPFCWKFDLMKDDCGAYHKVAEGLQLAVEKIGDRVYVKALVKTREFILSDSRLGEDFATSISVLSVLGIDVSGKLVHTPTLTLEETTESSKQNTA